MLGKIHRFRNINPTVAVRQTLGEGSTIFYCEVHHVYTTLISFPRECLKTKANEFSCFRCHDRFGVTQFVSAT